MNKNIRQLIYKKYEGHCAYCGCKLEYKEMQVDHIIPIARGHSDALMKTEKLRRGKEDISNYNPACRACNFRKGMLNIEEFRQAIINGLKVLEKDFTYRLMHKYGLIKFGKSKVTFYFERKHK